MHLSLTLTSGTPDLAYMSGKSRSQKTTTTITTVTAVTEHGMSTECHGMSTNKTVNAQEMSHGHSNKALSYLL